MREFKGTRTLLRMHDTILHNETYQSPSRSDYKHARAHARTHVYIIINNMHAETRNSYI